ncbi:hypothetical protein LQZ21_06850 [Treponema sp. TIM-1]|uniref:LPO_1073/Vpar_1526 family protein n=1 Tax=Treponema sp. TIM-1 TaxID=2898417 RepID=UPI00397FCB44
MTEMSQKAGNNSTNIGVGGSLVIQNGISEQRVREIFDEKTGCAIAQFSSEAKKIASERINNFVKCLIPRMAETGSLNAFIDPDFQLLLIEAQKGAASTEREPDIKLLTELLVHRFAKQNDRSARIGISKAVNIVHQIPDKALLGLTVFYAVSQFIPKTGDIEEGLNILDDLFNRIIYDTLPEGTDWLDDLDVLDAIRIGRFRNLKKFEEFYPDKLPGYTCEGILENSEQHNEIIKILQDNKIDPNGFVVKHILSENHLRLNIINKEAIKGLTLKFSVISNGNIQKTSQKLSDQQKQAVALIAEQYMKIDVPFQENRTAFMKLLDERPSLKKVKEWWNKIGASFNTTSVGRVLAHANAQRCDNTLPPLD